MLSSSIIEVCRQFKSFINVLESYSKDSSLILKLANCLINDVIPKKSKKYSNTIII